MGAPVWPTPRPQPVETSAPARDEPFTRALGGLMIARAAQLALIFVVVSILVLAMSLVAQAMR